MTTSTDPKALAVQLINTSSHQEARTVAAGLKGKTLAAVADLLGIALYGNADQRRHTVARGAIGGALDSAAIRYYGRPGEGEAFLASYRARRIAALGEDLV